MGFDEIPKRTRHVALRFARTLTAHRRLAVQARNRDTCSCTYESPFCCWSSGVEYESYTIVGVAFGLPGSLSWWKSFKVRLFSGCRSVGLFGFANVGIGVFVVIVVIASSCSGVFVLCCCMGCCGGVLGAICGAVVGLGCGALAV